MKTRCRVRVRAAVAVRAVQDGLARPEAQHCPVLLTLQTLTDTDRQYGADMVLGELEVPSVGAPSPTPL